MRIAFVICGDLDHVSGGFHYDRMLIGELRARGAVVDVIALPWRRRYARALLDNLLPWPLHAAEYDVVVEDQLCHPAVLGRNRRLRQAGLPLVSLVHNLTSCQPGTRWRSVARACERNYFRGIDAVIAVCASTAADVAGCAARALPTFVARAGRDEGGDLGDPAITARAHAAGPLRLVFVGQVAPHKGLHRLLPALADLHDVDDRAPLDVTLDVAGSLSADAGYVAEVRALAARRGVGHRLTWHGELDRPATAALLARSHILVMPSDREAYPLAALEGAGAGLALLLTNAGGTSELLGSSGAGQLLAPDDSRAWADAIASLARDREALAAAGRAARARHRAHGSWADVAAGVADFLAYAQSLRRKT